MKTLIIVDLESTCDENDRLARSSMEIIEIGAISVNLGTGEVIDRYQSLIKPLRHPALTPFCSNLTGITQADVDQAKSIYEVFPEFRLWVDRQPKPSMWGSWGGYDKNQIAQDCQHFRLPNPINMKHLNLRSIYGLATTGRKMGLGRAINHEDLVLQGERHRALDDAESIYALLKNNQIFFNKLKQACGREFSYEP